jgi:hypothetical protein
MAELLYGARLREDNPSVMAAVLAAPPEVKGLASHQLDWKRESVDRLFRLNHATRLEQFDAAFRALGRRVEISVH